VRGFQIRPCLRKVASATASKTVSTGDAGKGPSCLIAAARGRASVEPIPAASPTVLQTRLPSCWQWMNQRLAPEGITRTPKPFSLPPRMSRADFRGSSALTRASVRVDGAIVPFSRSVAAGNRKPSWHCPAPHVGQEKET